MTPFSISCTTCKVGLKVTHPDALGEIVPCPKCGSMVMVPETNPAIPVAPSPTSSVAFEDLDHVFNEESAAPQFSAENVASEKWKFPRDQNSASEQTPEVDAPTLDTTTSHASTFLLRRIFLFGGGIAAGTILAVGLAMSLNSGDQQSPNEETQTSQNDRAPRDVVRSEVAPNGTDESHEAVANDPHPHGDFQMPGDSTLDNSAEPNASDDAETSLLAIEQRNSNSFVDDGTSAPAQEDGTTSPEQPEVENRSAPIDILSQGDDDLSDFARWLQDSAMQPQSPVADDEPVPRPKEPEFDPVEIVEKKTRPTPRLVDVKARLSDPIAGVQFRSGNLHSLIRFVTQYSTIPITLDTDALTYRNISPKKSIQLDTITNTNVRKLLTGVARQARLGIVEQEGHILVTSADAATKKQRLILHDVSDLPHSAAELKQLVLQFVNAPDWKENDGIYTINATPGKLEVDAIDLVHFRILRLLERLRLANELPAKSRRASTFSLIRACDQNEQLKSLVSVRLPFETSVLEVAQLLEAQTKSSILFDWSALHTIGWSPRDAVGYFGDNVALQDALAGIFNGSAVSIVILNDSVLLVTSQMAALQRSEIEFYEMPVEKEDYLLRIERLKARFPQAHIQYVVDDHSHRVILSAPQQAHRELSD